MKPWPSSTDSLSLQTHLGVLRNEVREKFIRSSGPGGQNVNKLATAVQLKLKIKHSAALPETVLQRLLRLLGSRVSPSGVWVITAQRFRTQEKNREDAWQRMEMWIRKAWQEPKTRKHTKPSKASVARRLSDKSHQSLRKQNRNKNFNE